MSQISQSKTKPQTTPTPKRPHTTKTQTEPTITKIKSVACPICGCLCDDLEVTIENNQITKIKKGCAVCEAKMVQGYRNDHRIQSPMIRKEGKLVPVSMKEAVQKAAQILTSAKYPLLYGWGSAASEAQKVGVELAEEIGGALDNNGSSCHGPSVMGAQEAGIPTCTLGQVKHRADLIIYWACNPWASHPRHVERYTAFAEGRFERSEWKSYIQKVKGNVSRKNIDLVNRRIKPKYLRYQLPQKDLLEAPPQTIHRIGRKLIVVDVVKTMTAEAADYFVQVEPNRDYEVIEALRCLVNDQEIDVEKVGGVPVVYLREVAEAMVNCGFGVVFFGLGLTESVGQFRNSELILALTRDLNRKTKFAAMPMRGPYNVTGANMVFAWQTGYPYALDFSQGYPQYNPGEFTAVDMLRRGDNDATLVISSDPGAHFPASAIKKMMNHPLIVINPDMNCISRLGDVIFPTQWCGIECEGTGYRMDHVPIRLRKVVEAPRGILSDEQILRKILAEVKQIKKARETSQKQSPRSKRQL
jgi:formylmethanofuran dehydrogenase subunit B